MKVRQERKLYGNKMKILVEMAELIGNDKAFKSEKSLEDVT